MFNNLIFNFPFTETSKSLVLNTIDTIVSVAVTHFQSDWFNCDRPTVEDELKNVFINRSLFGSRNTTLVALKLRVSGVESAYCDPDFAIKNNPRMAMTNDTICYVHLSCNDSGFHILVGDQEWVTK